MRVNERIFRPAGGRDGLSGCFAMFYVIQTASLTDLESPQNPHLLAPDRRCEQERTSKSVRELVCMTQNMAKHPLKPFPPSNSPGTRPPARGTAHLRRCLRGHICAALARFRPPWRLCLARMRHLTWLLAHEGRARHFPRRGSEGKKLGRYSRGNQGLEELADWLSHSIRGSPHDA